MVKPGKRWLKTDKERHLWTGVWKQDRDSAFPVGLVGLDFYILLIRKIVTYILQNSFFLDTNPPHHYDGNAGQGCTACSCPFGNYVSDACNKC